MVALLLAVLTVTIALFPRISRAARTLSFRARHPHRNPRPQPKFEHCAARHQPT